MKNEKTDKSVLEESLIDFNKIQKMMMESSGSAIKDIINEKVKEGLKNIITEADDFEEEELAPEEETEKGMDDTDSESDESLESENKPEDIDGLDGEGIEDDDIKMDGDETDNGMEPEDGENEEDFDFDEFKTGDDEYDLTNKSIEDVVKVFKKIDDSDSIIVKKLENGKIDLIDNEADTEYLIDMGDDDFENELDDEDENDADLDDVTEEFDETPDDGGLDTMSEETEIEIELDGAESAVDEKNMTQSIGTNRRAGRMTQTRQEYAPGKATNRDGSILIANESKQLAKAYAKKIKQIEESYSKKIKSINEEVSQYKQTLLMFRDKLKESAVLNNNLAKYTKLVTENATTKDEKIKILERFSKEANTIEAGNKLFESINSELNDKKGSDLGISIEKQFSVSAPSKRLDEQVIYKSKDLQETIGLINRMKNL